MEVIQQFEYEGQQIEFDLSTNLMINATDMANTFGKKVENFTRLDNTKSFIDEALNNANQRYLDITSKDDLIISKQRTGTWMHRILALKFAAWLDPAFELWVFYTIDRIMFGSLREDVKAKAQLQVEKELAYEELRKSPFYQKIVELEGKEKKIQGQISKQQKVQLDLFGKA